jgi:chromosome segregation ATPase
MTQPSQPEDLAEQLALAATQLRILADERDAALAERDAILAAHCGDDRHDLNRLRASLELAQDRLVAQDQEIARLQTQLQNLWEQEAARRAQAREIHEGFAQALFILKGRDKELLALESQALQAAKDLATAQTRLVLLETRLEAGAS